MAGKLTSLMMMACMAPPGQEAAVCSAVGERGRYGGRWIRDSKPPLVPCLFWQQTVSAKIRRQERGNEGGTQVPCSPELSHASISRSCKKTLRGSLSNISYSSTIKLSGIVSFSLCPIGDLECGLARWSRLLQQGALIRWKSVRTGLLGRPCQGQ